MHGRDDQYHKNISDPKSNWKTGEGLVWYKDQIYVPKDYKLREEILRTRHDTPAAGHPAFWKMKELVERDFYWPSLHNDVRKYIRGCDTCQRVKIN